MIAVPILSLSMRMWVPAGMPLDAAEGYGCLMFWWIRRNCAEDALNLHWSQGKWCFTNCWSATELANPAEQVCDDGNAGSTGTAESCKRMLDVEGRRGWLS